MKKIYIFTTFLPIHRVRIEKQNIFCIIQIFIIFYPLKWEKFSIVISKKNKIGL